MLLLIWCAVGVVLGRFVRRQSIALALVGAVWGVSIATIAARGGSVVAVDGDSVGVLATLVIAVLGCVAGSLWRLRASAARGAR